MKTQLENPNGLHQRYVVQKIENDTIVPCDPEAEYFILRLDNQGKDLNHIAACRKAVMKYAEEIEPHIPQLAKDIREQWG